LAVFGEEGMSQNPLLDLELLRRRLDTWPSNRARAEIWMLQNRQSGEELIYEWAAWYFDYQRLFTETAQLLKEAERKGMTGSWLDLHRSIALIIEGKTAEGEKILKEAFNRPAAVDWRIPANLGRIQESRRAISAATEYYETAAALLTGKKAVREKKAAAQVQMRLSRCLETLGRTHESRRAVEYALELDPDNLNIRRELRRLDSQ
jgi:tetratricopeptide (TPR) repeat protein